MAARLIDGVCPRITMDYREGKGDLGLSNGVYNQSLSKNNIIFKLHSAIEELRVELSKLILNYKDNLGEDDLRFLTWLRNNTFSIGAFIYLKGKTDRHNLPISALSFIKDRISTFKQDIGNAPDFIIYDNPIGIDLDNIRILVRNLESYITELDMSTFENKDNFILYKRFINRLSAYIFWLNRETNKILGYEEIYWTGSMDNFN